MLGNERFFKNQEKKQQKGGNILNLNNSDGCKSLDGQKKWVWIITLRYLLGNTIISITGNKTSVGREWKKNF